ncbi:hypothetical protein DEO72_LG9g2045 [Vigna unguiculata]|uniref:Uncharacterized protein n=1 Tax=Vigna unguiculata TaxID=3917 RepID=A0A4D6MZN6_VIGUN|nr:hypothetical protein DEO72_LG9g2045 [Vigna unguiculata]
MDDKFVKIENELAIVKNHMQKLFVYIASKEDVSEDLATIIVCLVHSSTNEVPDVGNDMPSPTDVIRSNGGSKPF